MKILNYKIDSYSSFSKNFEPENIIKDTPTQVLRWMPLYENKQKPEWIILKLNSTSIVEKIFFGKYYKIHFCNLKEFKLYLGLTKDDLKLSLQTGKFKCKIELKNNEEEEGFNLKNKKTETPCNYIKIELISSWTENFNPSIFHIKIFGENDKQIIKKSLEEYNNVKIIFLQSIMMKKL
jgi:muskelin